MIPSCAAIGLLPLTLPLEISPRGLPPPRGGGGLQGISRQTVVPSTNASKQNTDEATWVMQPPQPRALRVEHSHDPLEGPHQGVCTECGPFGEGPTTLASTCVPSVREQYTVTGRKRLGSVTTTLHPVHRLWREDITEYTQVTDLK